MPGPYSFKRLNTNTRQMKYDPTKHNRRSIRLKGYNYAQPGYYFITICTDRKFCLFGAIANNQLHLNEFGRIAFACWQAIPEHFPRIKLDRFVVMPNHVHGILIMTDAGRGKALPCPYEGKFGKPVAGSIPTIIGSYKSVVTKQINILRQLKGTTVWQRNYYEHIIRGEESLNRIRNYIVNNPLSWTRDRFYSTYK